MSEEDREGESIDADKLGHSLERVRWKAEKLPDGNVNARSLIHGAHDDCYPLLPALVAWFLRPLNGATYFRNANG